VVLLLAAVVVVDALVTIAVVDELSDPVLVTIVVLLEAAELVVVPELLDVPVVVGGELDVVATVEELEELDVVLLDAGATTSRDNAQ
jgi:hypothetical protein